MHAGRTPPGTRTASVRRARSTTPGGGQTRSTTLRSWARGWLRAADGATWIRGPARESGGMKRGGRRSASGAARLKVSRNSSWRTASPEETTGTSTHGQHELPALRPASSEQGSASSTLSQSRQAESSEATPIWPSPPKHKTRPRSGATPARRHDTRQAHVARVRVRRSPIVPSNLSRCPASVNRGSWSRHSTTNATEFAALVDRGGPDRLHHAVPVPALEPAVDRAVVADSCRLWLAAAAVCPPARSARSSPGGRR
jgi:hypothetical protein